MCLVKIRKYLTRIGNVGGSVAPDISGQAFLAVAVPAGLVGSTVWLQALERVGTQPWTPSNGVQAIVQ